MKNELTSLKVSCKYNRKAKICTPEKIEQAKKYRTRGWTFKRIGEKIGISKSRTAAIINGETETTLENRRRISRKYYQDNREHCISRCYENEILKRQNVPGYYKRMLKRNNERYQSDPEFKEHIRVYGKEYRKSKHTVKKTNK